MADYGTSTMDGAYGYEQYHHADFDWSDAVDEADARADAKETKRRQEAAQRINRQAERDELADTMAKLDQDMSFAALLEAM